MTTQLVATVPQVLKLAGMFADVPREHMTGIGFGLAAVMAKYLRQPVMKPLNLDVLHQVLGLPPLEDSIWVTVDWREAQPVIHDGSATFRQRAKQYRTRLARLRPIDIGFSNGDLPCQVNDLALAWGYQRVPRRALETLLRNNPPLASGRYPGDVMVLLDDGHYAYFRVGHDGLIRAIDQMDVTAPNFATTWSVIVAIETRQLVS